MADEAKQIVVVRSSIIGSSGEEECYAEFGVKKLTGKEAHDTMMDVVKALPTAFAGYDPETGDKL